MKKGFVFALLLLLIFGSFVVAVNDSNQIGMDLRQAGKQIADKGKSVLSSQVAIPTYLQGISKLFFGFDNGTTLDVFIVILMVWIVIFVFMLYIMPFVPFFHSKLTSIFGALIVTLLIGISGGLKDGAYFFLTLGGILNFLDAWPTLKFFIAVVIIIAILFLGSNIFRMLRMRYEIALAEKTGEDIAEGSRFAKIFSFAGKKLGER